MTELSRVHAEDVQEMSNDGHAAKFTCQQIVDTCPYAYLIFTVICPQVQNLMSLLAAILIKTENWTE